MLDMCLCLSGAARQTFGYMWAANQNGNETTFWIFEKMESQIMHATRMQSKLRCKTEDGGRR